MSIAPEAIAAARAAQRRWNIPASITLAQYGVESGFGWHMPPGSNNPFGIKARPGEPAVEAMTTEIFHGVDRREEQPFRKFASLAEAFDYHAELLATAPVYAIPRSMLLGGLTVAAVNAFAAALTHRYATDPGYGRKLIALMRADDLYRHDAAVEDTAPVVAPSPIEPPPPEAR
ncbi:MAG TPA: glucosaminidase domain-containing protein [Caulobacteraceae bacterium]